MFKNLRVATAELSFKGNTVVDAKSRAPWAIPLEGRISFTVGAASEASG